MKDLEILDLRPGSTKGTVEHKISRYPDGQVNVDVERDMYGAPVLIQASLRSFDVLQEVAAAVSALREAHAGGITLDTPYFLGARSDRRFGRFSSHYLKDVICPFVNSLGFESVRVLDPHSDVLPALLDRVVVQRPCELYNYVGSIIGWDAVVVCPDAGAQKRAMDYVKVNMSPPVVYCSKNRDVATGKILATHIPVESFDGKTVVIVDDICDGGATFLNLGREIRERKCGRLYLVVTHGVFSAGFHLLEGVFDRIYCTDSYSTVDHPLVAQYRL